MHCAPINSHAFQPKTQCIATYCTKKMQNSKHIVLALLTYGICAACFPNRNCLPKRCNNKLQCIGHNRSQHRQFQTYCIMQVWNLKLHSTQVMKSLLSHSWTIVLPLTNCNALNWSRFSNNRFNSNINCPFNNKLTFRQWIFLSNKWIVRRYTFPTKK